MKEIKLTQDKVTIVDDEDYNYLMQWKWFALKGYKTYYACRMSTSEEHKNNKRHTIYMHRVIMKLKHSDRPDHADRNGLNNQKFNLRKVTRSQNATNAITINTTGYRGVFYDKRINKFAARIVINGKKTTLGSFTNPIDAAKKYDKCALKYQGEFAITNFNN